MIFDALAEIIEKTQLLVNNGWQFTYEPSDYCPKMIAKKGDKARSGYESEGIERFLDFLCQEDQQEYEDKLIVWLKSGGVCPKCNIKPDLNCHFCKICGWKL